MSPAPSSSAATLSATRLLAMFAKEAVNLLRLHGRSTPAAFFKEPVTKSLPVSGTYSLSTPFLSCDMGTRSSVGSSGSSLLSRALTGSLFERAPDSSGSSGLSGFDKHQVLRASRVAASLAGKERAALDRRNGEINKMTLSLEKRFPDKVVGEMALSNMKSLLELRARTGEIVRLFSSNHTFYDKEHGKAMKSKSEVLKRFGLKSRVLCKALSKSTDWLEATDAGVAELLDYLDKDLGVNNLAKLVSVNPQALSLEIDTVKEIVEYLKILDVEDTGAAIGHNPSLLGKGKDAIEAKVSTLENLLGLDKSRIRVLADKRPALISCESETVREAYDALVQIFGKDKAIILVTRNPQLLTISSSKLIEMVEGLIGMFTIDEALKMVMTCPLLVRRKWDVTHQKILFLTEEMKRSLAEIVEWPAAMTFSLKERLEPRYKAILEECTTRDIFRSFTLRSMFGCTNETFERRFNVKLPRIKRSTAKISQATAQPPRG